MEFDDDIYVTFQVTREQAERIAKHYNVELDKIENYELCEYIDRFLDEEL